MLILALLVACDSAPTPAPSTAPAFVAPTGTPAAPAAPAAMPTMPASMPGMPGAAPAAPDAPATPREAADQAFNTAMRAYEMGQPEAAQAVPAALAAYAQLKDLDTDGQFHFALLQLAGGDTAAARKTCDALLQAHPDHLFALATSARAAEKAKDPVAARAMYDRLLNAWDKPREALPEYQDHERLLPVYQKEALSYLASHPAK